jgi:hypothetical protein
MMNVTIRPSTARRHQSGITLVGLLFWAVLISSIALVLMKVFPAVVEYRTISSMVNKAAHEGGGTVPEIRTSFERSAAVEYGVTSIKARDLEITKEDDKVVVKFAYDREIELVDPVYLLLKFKGQSK